METKEKGDSGEPYGDVNAPPSDSREDLREPSKPTRGGERCDEERPTVSYPTTVWIRCDVYDTGIGIPGLVIHFFC